MERELIFSKRAGVGRKELMWEIEMMKKIFPVADSFESFKTSSEVFDISKRKTVTNWFRLWNVFRKGAEKNISYFIIGKN